MPSPCTRVCALFCLLANTRKVGEARCVRLSTQPGHVGRSRGSTPKVVGKKLSMKSRETLVVASRAAHLPAVWDGSTHGHRSTPSACHDESRRRGASSSNGYRCFDGDALQRPPVNWWLSWRAGSSPKRALGGWSKRGSRPGLSRWLERAANRVRGPRCRTALDSDAQPIPSTPPPGSC